MSGVHSRDLKTSMRYALGYVARLIVFMPSEVKLDLTASFLARIAATYVLTQVVIFHNYKRTRRVPIRLENGCHCVTFIGVGNRFM